jgi:hypothetical protein
MRDIMEIQDSSFASPMTTMLDHVADGLQSSDLSDDSSPDVTLHRSTSSLSSSSAASLSAVTLTYDSRVTTQHDQVPGVPSHTHGSLPSRQALVCLSRSTAPDSCLLASTSRGTESATPSNANTSSRGGRVSSAPPLAYEKPIVGAQHKRRRVIVACKDCGRVFGCRSNLRRHSRTHTGAEPYACRVCLRRFSDCSNCRKHEVGCRRSPAANHHASPIPEPAAPSHVAPSSAAIATCRVVVDAGLSSGGAPSAPSLCSERSESCRAEAAVRPGSTPQGPQGIVAAPCRPPARAMTQPRMTPLWTAPSPPSIAWGSAGTQLRWTMASHMNGACALTGPSSSAPRSAFSSPVAPHTTPVVPSYHPHPMLHGAASPWAHATHECLSHVVPQQLSPFGRPPPQPHVGCTPPHSPSVGKATPTQVFRESGGNRGEPIEQGPSIEDLVLLVFGDVRGPATARDLRTPCTPPCPSGGAFSTHHHGPNAVTSPCPSGTSSLTLSLLAGELAFA